jgi:hypothetical protein
MSPIDAFRNRRNHDGLPTSATDEELLAWSEDLLAPSQVRTRPARTQPLVAEGRTRLGLDEVLHEIEQRARAAYR